MHLLACDQYGAVFLVAPDGSYTPYDHVGSPSYCRVIRGLKYWLVVDAAGAEIAVFRTRKDARNFVRHHGRGVLS